MSVSFKSRGSAKPQRDAPQSVSTPIRPGLPLTLTHPDSNQRLNPNALDENAEKARNARMAREEQSDREAESAKRDARSSAGAGDGCVPAAGFRL